MKATRLALLAALMVAVTVAAGQALSAIPNVELVTFLVFVSGYLLGPGLGAAVGGAAMGAHSLFNVQGAAPPPVWVAQMACYALVGLAGGVVGPRVARVRAVPASLLAGVTGAFLAFFYQLVVNFTTFFVFTNQAGIWAYVLGGLAFAGVQIVWNAGLFFVSMRPTLSVLSRFLPELHEER